MLLDTSTKDKTFLDNTCNHPYDTADVVLLGIACEITASYRKGTFFGPYEILDASHQVEYEVPIFHKSLTDNVKIHNLGVLRDMGPPAGVAHRIAEKCNLETLDEMVVRTGKAAERVLGDGKLLMLFGGDHSVPNGVWNAIRGLYGPTGVTVLQLDAHLDLRNRLDGTKYSHACIMRRAREKGFRVIQAGMRDHISGEEAGYIRRAGIRDDLYFCPTQCWEIYKKYGDEIERQKVIEPKNLLYDGSPDQFQMIAIKEKIAGSKGLWISVDVDCLDASSVPGTGTPLSMGMTSKGVRSTLYGAIEAARENGVRLLGFDICEVASQKVVAEGVQGNAVSTMNEMEAALLAFNMLFWNYIGRFEPKR